MTTENVSIPAHDWIAVIDFGAQYSQLIARRVRECQVYCELWPHTTALADLLARKPKGIILSGGPASVYAPGAPAVDPAVFECGLPVLGICYGMQLMAKSLGGQVEEAEKREYGRTLLHITGADELFAGLPTEGITCWMSHGDVVREVPSGFVVTARTDNAPVAAMKHAERRLYAVQFHPEVVHTTQGRDIIRNFAVGICGCRADWTVGNYIRHTVEEIRQQVGRGKAICALSGGVDSAVAATLVQQAIGDQLTCIFVNHGFMRQNEPEKLREIFTARMGKQFIMVDAADRFLDKLEGVGDPETKRKLIGEEFIRVFEQEAARLGDNVRYLVQGTIYPDVIESGTGAANLIKSHHNVGGLPAQMKLDLIEPLRYLFKDEVRRLGLELGLPESMIWRQPFPGPGLAIRTVGTITRERVELVRKADAIVTEEVEKAGLAREIWQYFAVLTDTRSVGVMGDGRTYGYVVAIRAITSIDAMTADWARLPYELLDRIAGRIMSEVKGISRVVYDISSKPPATICWE